MDIYWLLLAFVLKHFVCDYILQRDPWQYQNKGTYGHPGGLFHALIHACGTAVVLAALWPGPHTDFWLVIGPIMTAWLFDGLIHYHIDWAKVNVCKEFDWRPDNSDNYWFVLGLDQLLHYLTYFAIVWAVAA